MNWSRLLLYAAVLAAVLYGLLSLLGLLDDRVLFWT